METKYPPHVQKLLDQLSLEQRKAQIVMIGIVRGLGLVSGLCLAVLAVGACIALYHPQVAVVRDAVVYLEKDVGSPLAHMVILVSSLAVLSAGVRTLVASTR